jgi:hypothetical protein
MQGADKVPSNAGSDLITTNQLPPPQAVSRVLPLSPASCHDLRVFYRVRAKAAAG